MRIALTNPDINLTGGVERAITETANTLVGRGHDVTVYGARIDRAVLDGRVGVRRVPVPAGLDNRTGLGFRALCTRMLGADRPDVHGAFGTLSPADGVFWVPSVHREGYELLLSRRNLPAQLAVKLHPYHLVRLRLEASMFGRDGCAVALAQTERIRSEIERWYGSEVRQELLPYGYDDTAFHPARRRERRADARARFGYRADDHVLLFAGNELERKGFDVLLAAVAQVPRVKVLGAGRIRPARDSIARLGLEDRVQWAGHVGDIGLLHAASDALVLPTKYEPWGLVIVEALGSGLPVATTRLAGAAIAVQDGRTGRLLDDPEDATALADHIRWLVAGQALSDQEISATVSGFAWPETIARYEAILQRYARHP